MAPVTDRKKILFFTLIFLLEISVFSADVTTAGRYDNWLLIIGIIFTALFIYLLYRYVKLRKEHIQIKKEILLREKDVENIKKFSNDTEKTLEDEKLTNQSLINTAEMMKEQNNSFLLSIASADEKKIEQSLKQLIPEIEKILIKSFEKGERIKIDELGIDLNKKKVLTLERSVLFEDYDGSGKNIFFYPVKGGQQNIGAVICLLKDTCKTENSFISYLNSIACIVSSVIIRKKYEKYTQDFQQNIILSLVNILELHDENEKGHSERVAKLAVEIGETMKLPQSDIIQIYWVGMIHDIGKIFLPYALRSKRARMTVKEFELFQKHSIWGENIIGTNDELDDISKYVRHHHERWDGKGYPDKLSGAEIPLISRIITVADSYDNAQNRPLDSFNQDDNIETLEMIAQNSGKAFDPQVVQAFMSLQYEKEDTD